MPAMTGRTRWLALYVLCLGDLMIVLDTDDRERRAPSIRADLGFSQTSLAWVVNAYMLTLRRLPAARRAARRPLRPPALVPDRDRVLHRRLARVRLVASRRAC